MRMTIILGIICWVNLMGPVQAQELEAEKDQDQAEQVDAAAKAQIPLKKRDPFRPEVELSKRVSTGPREKVDPIINLLSSIRLDQIEVKGVMLGKESVAFISYKDGDTITLKEGMEIGPTNERAVLKAILPGGVVFVEKLINVYGQEEYLETVIPVISGEDVKIMTR